MTAPEDIGGVVERARRATQRRDWLEASRCWDEVRASWPDYAPAYLGAGIVLREAGRYDDAELILETGAERFPQDEQIAIARANLANARRDWPAALIRWEAARASFPDNPQCCLGIANALRGLGRSDQVENVLLTAEAVLAAAKQRGMDAPTALRVEFEIARARLDWPALRQSAENIIAREAAPPARIFLALAQACWHMGDRDEADRAALRAIAIDPKLSDAVLVRASVATDRGDGETALSCYRTLARLNPAAVRWPLKVVQLLNWLGQVRESVSELENICKRWPKHPIVRAYMQRHGFESAGDYPAEDDSDAARHEIEAIAGKAPTQAKRLRPLLVADPERDVLLAQVSNAETAVLIFTGGKDQLSMPLPLFDRYLATLDVTAIYLKDFHRLWYLTGVKSLAPDYQGTLAALRDMLARHGVKRVCTMGNCAGGFAAIRYGVELGADRILALGPLTYMAKGEEDPNPQSFLSESRRFMRGRVDSKVPQDVTDIKSFLETRRHSAQIELFYAEEDPRRIHQLRLSGLPGIRLHPQPEPLGDRLLRRLAVSRADFRGMLGQLLGVGPGVGPAKRG